MKRHLMLVATVASLGIVSQVNAGGGVPLPYFEDFNSVTLGDSVNERLGFPLVTRVETDPDSAPIPNAFTHTGPAGWTVDNNWNNFGNAAGAAAGGVDLDNPEYATGDIVGNTGMFNQGDPNNGVAEWEGWSFANKDFWNDVAGQGRGDFAFGIGTVAIADGDEYDDLGLGVEPGYMNTGMTTGNIDVSSVAGSPVKLHYDSTWRAEADDSAHTGNATLQANWEALDPGNVGVPYVGNNQTAVVWASYDGAAPVRINIWDSRAGSATLHPDNTNEHVDVTAFVPGGASNVKFSFGYLNAANDWWWAIDNLELTDFGGGTSLWSEDFEGLTLGDSVNERQSTIGAKVTAVNNDPNTSPRPNSFTNVAPAGWSVDNSLLPFETTDPVGNNNIGSYELEGWNFMDLDFWTFVDQSGRQDFAKASGSFAVADGDEWDDLGDPTDFGEMNTLMVSPVIDLGGNTADLVLQFDSSWRAEDSQQVIITVDFGAGPVEILHWTSDPLDSEYHGDNTNETVSVTTPIPAGATTAQYDFRYQGTNDWWWAVDNISVNVVPEPTSMALAALGLLGIAVAGRRR